MSVVPLSQNATKKVDTIYDVKFIIGNDDYSKSVFKVQVGASIDMIFGMITIGFQQTSRDSIKEEIFGQKEVYLTITQTTYDRVPMEELYLNLMVLKVSWEDSHPDTASYNSEETQQYRPKKIYLVCVPKNAYISQYTLVNKLFQAGSGMRPIDAVKKIADKLTIPKIISETSANPEIIPQMIIPPTSFISAFRYIDKKYPIYEGKPLVCFVQLYKDTLTIWDLRSRISDKSDYNVRFLTSGSADKTDIQNTPIDSSSGTVTYFTAGPIIRKFNGNKKIAGSFYKNAFITKPKNKRSNYIEKSIPEIYLNDSLTKSGSSVSVNKSLVNMTRVYSDIISSQYSDILPRSIMSEGISDFSDIYFRMTGPNFPFLRLTEIGGGIDIISNDVIYQEYLGRYIVKKSVLSFERHETTVGYNLNVTINCTRGYYGNQ